MSTSRCPAAARHACYLWRMDAEEDPLGLDSWPPELDRDAVGPALRAFAEVVGDTEDYELIITSDFEEQVRERMEPELAAAFYQDRGAYGKAMAKTLREHDGRVVVVFDVQLFARDVAHPAEATFRHEALHVVLIGNGENTFDSRASLAERSELSPELVAMAGIAVEEYQCSSPCTVTARMTRGGAFTHYAPPVTTRSTGPPSPSSGIPGRMFSSSGPR